MATKHPKEKHPTPPFPRQTQSSPGLESQMEPKPDYGVETYHGLGRLRGKRALITGGDSGIGRAVALAFAREGAHVAFSHLAEEGDDAKETLQAIQRDEQLAVALRADLSSPEACRTLVRSAQQALDGPIDVLVNNAAFQGKAVESFEEIDDQRIEHTFRVNVMSMFHLVRASLPSMRPGSSIINVASIQASKPSPGILDYATTKGAVVTFTKGLAQTLIERGIRVNCVAPGPVWTPIVVASFDAEKNATFGADSPMGRPAQPAELAPPFVFLASEESQYVNGEVLGVTGGKPLP
jgi:NAD(P)-dependent dehydrogenase (short-subunit alcohol dehydrogenase family)